MSFTYGLVIFVVLACILYGAILWFARRRNWGVNRTAIVESLLFLICSMGTAVVWNAENDVPNSLVSTVVAPLIIALFAYFQTAFFYARLEKMSKDPVGDEVRHRAGKSQYDRERRRRSKRAKNI